jgi:hypothetical protein
VQECGWRLSSGGVAAACCSLLRAWTGLVTKRGRPRVEGRDHLPCRGQLRRDAYAQCVQTWVTRGTSNRARGTCDHQSPRGCECRTPGDTSRRSHWPHSSDTVPHNLSHRCHAGASLPITRQPFFPPSPPSGGQMAKVTRAQAAPAACVKLDQTNMRVNQLPDDHCGAPRAQTPPLVTPEVFGAEQPRQSALETQQQLQRHGKTHHVNTHCCCRCCCRVLRRTQAATLLLLAAASAAVASGDPERACVLGPAFGLTHGAEALP